MLVCRYYCRNIGCICMALQLRPDRQVSALLFWPDFDFVWFISQPHMLQFSLLIRWKANPAKPNWERLRKYFSGNLKFIRLLAGLASDTVEHLDWQTDFIFIHLRDFQRRFSEYDDNDNSNDDAHAPISAETHVRSKNSTRELGDWGSGSCGCFMIYCLDTACVMLPLCFQSGLLIPTSPPPPTPPP